MSMLPGKNVVGKSKISHSVLETDNWKSAKEQSDKAAADRVIDDLWSDKNTSNLKSHFQDPSDIVFITVPSTSRRNAIPLSLAERLSGDFGCKYFSGNEYFVPVHGQQSKHIPRLKRPFKRREYVTENIETLKKECTGKSVVVVDDILTTGGSVASFSRSLNDNGIEVQSVAALMGDKRLNIDLNTQARLDFALKEAGLSFNSEALTARLTRVEAGGLIMQINSARTENAKQKIAGNLHGLLDQRPFKDMGRDTASRRHKGPQGKDHGDGQITERVQAWRFWDKGGVINSYEITVKSAQSGREYKNVVTTGQTLNKQEEQKFLTTKSKDFAASIALKEGIKNAGELSVNIKKVEMDHSPQKAQGIGRTR